MRSIAWAALLCLVLAVAARAAETPPSPADRMEQIRTALVQGDSRQAYRLLEEADWDVTKLPADELATLAELDLQLWRYGLAIRIARLALDRHGQPPAPVEAQADPFVQRMNRVLAISLYLTARGGGPTTELAKLDRKTALDTSESLFRELADAPQSNPRDLFWLAKVLTEKGEEAEAREVFDRYLARVGSDDLDPDAERLRQCLQSPAFDDLEAGADSDAIQPPRKLQSPSPQYTEAARHAGIEGEVVLRAIIDREGQPICLSAEKGLPLGLTEMAIRTMSTWRFAPATLNGKPVPVLYYMTFKFAGPEAN